MRPFYVAAASALLLGAAMGALGIGCLSSAREDCAENPALACFWDRLGYASGGGAGGDSGTPMECVPSESNEAVPDVCGVFAAKNGKDSNAGTKERPVATLAKAVELAKEGNRRVYACAEMFEEALALDARVEIFGGLDCGGAWGYAGGEKKTTLTAAADEVPLRVTSGATGSRLEDVAIVASDAMAAGASSVAAVIEGADVELARCAFVAGAGRDGENGQTPSEAVGPADPNDPAIKGMAGAAACMGSGSGNLGGAGRWGRWARRRCWR